MCECVYGYQNVYFTSKVRAFRVGVRSWGMCYVSESPFKDRSLCLCVGGGGSRRPCTWEYGAEGEGGEVGWRQEASCELADKVSRRWNKGAEAATTVLLSMSG